MLKATVMQADTNNEMNREDNKKQGSRDNIKLNVWRLFFEVPHPRSMREETIRIKLTVTASNFNRASMRPTC